MGEALQPNMYILACINGVWRIAWRSIDMQQQRPAHRASKLISVQPFLYAIRVKYVPAIWEFIHQIFLFKLHQANRTNFFNALITIFAQIQILKLAQGKI